MIGLKTIHNTILDDDWERQLYIQQSKIYSASSCSLCISQCYLLEFLQSIWHQPMLPSVVCISPVCISKSVEILLLFNGNTLK